jgi:hypothetical protein
MIDNIVGLACLPVGIVMFANEFGWMHVDKLFGMPILLAAALALVAIQLSNIFASHFQDHWLALSYGVHIFMAFPAYIYLLKGMIHFPAPMIEALPLMFASFILVEGMYSLFF